MSKLATALAVLAILLPLTCCGGGGAAIQDPVPDPVPDPLSVDAGPGATIGFTQIATLAGSVSDPTASVAWSQTSGPGAVSFEDPSAPATRAAFSTNGTYELQLAATRGMDTSTATVTVTVGAPVGDVMAVDPTVTYQTMRGWEFTDFAVQPSVAFDTFKDELFDMAANDLGLNRVRLEVNASAEHDADYYQQYLDGTIDYATWAGIRSSTVNDNSDPDSIDTNGFHWTWLDERVDTVVTPMKQRVEANGEKLWINACYVAFTNQNASQYGYIHDDPDEYAEFVLATYQHLESKYGWVPDSWEVILEPDNVPEWNGTLIGEAIVATAARLIAAGYTPRFVAPSISRAGPSFTYITQMHAVANASQYVMETAYHRYDNPSTTTIANIWAAAQQAGTETAHLERIGATYVNLHEDLEVGHNSSWSQYVLAKKGSDDGGGYFVVDDSDPDNPTVSLGSRTKFLRQYFKYVRKDAQRIAVTSAGVFAPLAFENADGRTVVVLKASGAGDFVLEGLPPATYGLKYTTSSAYDVDLPDAQVLMQGQALGGGIPAAGVITVYARP